jgi:hypothetical protein
VSTTAPLLPFGKFRGRPITEVDGGYLHWLFEKLDEWHSPALREAIIAERARRKGLASAEAPQHELPVERPREQSRRAPAPATATCGICGLGATNDRPLVHARCANDDEVPF